MKKASVLVVLFFSVIRVLAQSGPEKHIFPLRLDERKISITQLQPMINEMGANRIVGLGEGTHGTKEFNDLRISLIKELIENKGFRIICFENAFGDAYYFNEIVNSSGSIKEGMKKYLLSLWQNEEIETLFEWIREYNRSHSEKVSVSGMDFNYLANAAGIIINESKKANLYPLASLANDLYREALQYDAAWDAQMKGLDRSRWGGQLKSIRSILQQIDSSIKVDKLPVSELLQTAVLSVRAWSTGERGRDRSMALMAVQIAKNSKMIIWAHSVHLALKSPFKDNSVGGCGGYIKQEVPEYYSLGMGTAAGKYGGFDDRFDTRTNVMKRFVLPDVKHPSWDEYFFNMKLPAFFADLRNAEKGTRSLPLRLIGYGPPQRISYSDAIKLEELFDGYIFISKTNAPGYFR
ncbi:erythromycin esterase family protein [Niabella drilacis]|nr:erythromycin esterase family protein [Niabella drilacis]